MVYGMHSGRTALVVFTLLCLAGSAGAGEFCKWVDEDGVVHYSRECPDQTDSNIVETTDQRTESQLRSARDVSQSLLSSESEPSVFQQSHERYHSLPLAKLGPLPPNTRSKFLRTTGANYSLDNRTLRGSLVLFLQASDEMPDDAWVEAEFPDVSDLRGVDAVGKSVSAGDTVMLESPRSRGLKCWNYIVLVKVYADQEKSVLLGEHPQIIQSRINLSLASSVDDLVTGVTTGLCQKDDKVDFGRMSLQQLESLCEQEREKRLAPQRERLIKLCQERDGRSREYCENYYADYGDAKRVGPHQMRPALYMNLPACQAAREKREADR